MAKGHADTAWILAFQAFPGSLQGRNFSAKFLKGDFTALPTVRYVAAMRRYRIATPNTVLLIAQKLLPLDNRQSLTCRPVLDHTRNHPRSVSLSMMLSALPIEAIEAIEAIEVIEAVDCAQISRARATIFGCHLALLKAYPANEVFPDVPVSALQ